MKKTMKNEKCGAATVEAYPLSNVAKSIESMCKEKNFSEIPAAITNLKNELERLKIFVMENSD